jgi:hypothetical protein
MNFNIFRNPFIHSRVEEWKIEQGYAELAKDREINRRFHEEDLDLEYWRGYNNGYMDGYSDAEAHYDDWAYMNEDNEQMSSNADNLEMSANGDNDATSNN